MGQYSPKYWEFQTKSQTHCLFPIHAISLYNCLSSFLCTYTRSRNTCVRTHTHTHARTLNHTVDTDALYLQRMVLTSQHKRIFPHTCAWTYCSIFHITALVTSFASFLRTFQMMSSLWRDRRQHKF